jgi:hypothetical protein
LDRLDSVRFLETLDVEAVCGDGRGGNSLGRKLGMIDWKFIEVTEKVSVREIKSVRYIRLGVRPLGETT